jgi:hypothetical protein
VENVTILPGTDDRWNSMHEVESVADNEERLIGKIGVELCNGDMCSCSLFFLHVLLVSVFLSRTL